MAYNGPLPQVVNAGGTGDSSLTAYAVITGGTTSTSPLQSIASVGLSTEVLTSNGAGMLPSFQSVSASGALTSVNVQRFTSDGTYTPTSGMRYCIVEMVGGGGGGGGVSNPAATILDAAGGGSGGYAKVLLTAAQIGASQSVTIGAAGTAGANTGGTGGTGGTTSLGSLVSCTGGVGGSGNTGSGPVGAGVGGTPTVSTGTAILTMNGQNGADSLGTLNAVYPFSGEGGSNPLGFGGQSLGNSHDGLAGVGYGAGGSGAANNNGGGGGGAHIGGAGLAGTVIIMEFI